MMIKMCQGQNWRAIRANHCIMLMWVLAGQRLACICTYICVKETQSVLPNVWGSGSAGDMLYTGTFLLKNIIISLHPPAEIQLLKIGKKMPHWHINRFLWLHLSNEIHKNLIKVFKRSNFAKMHFGSEHFAHHRRMLTLMEKLAVAQ